MRNLLFATVMAAFILTIGGCKDDLKDIKDSLTVITASPNFDTQIGVEFIDANTGKYIDKKLINATISGKDGNDIYNNLGKQAKSFTVRNSKLLLVVNPKRIKSKALNDNPIEFVIKVSAEGYANYTQRVVISEEKLNIVKIKMVNLTDLPDGVSRAQSNNVATTTSNGSVQSSATVNLNSGTSTVEIPKGTILKDASGNPISGTVKSEILFFDPSVPAALNAFPGGLDIEAQLPDGTTGEINFMSAGVFGIDLSANGKEVKTIEGEGLKLTTKLDPEMMNPYTNAKIKAGDVIELWSMDSETGKWTYEKTATIKKSGSELFLQENINHLSFWNWDWYENSCGYGVKIQWVGDVVGANAIIEASMPGILWSKSIYTEINVNNSEYNHIQLYRLPQNTLATLKFSDGNLSWWSSPCDGQGEIVFSPSELNIDNLCENKTYTVNVTYKSKKAFTVNLDLTVVSNISKIQVKANAWFYFMRNSPECSYYWNYAFMSNGKLTMDNIILGETYTIDGSFGTTWGRGYIKVEDAGNNMVKVTFTSSFIFDYWNPWVSMPNLGEQVIIIPRPTNNTIDLKGTITVPDEIAMMLGM